MGIAVISSTVATTQTTLLPAARITLSMSRDRVFPKVFGTIQGKLKTPAVGEAASLVSAIPELRAALVAFQRDFAAIPPGAVIDGRDIGT